MTTAPPGSVAPSGAWPMYRSLGGIGALCGLLIVTVFVATRPVIRRNQAEALQRAIFQVLPEARTSATFRALEGGGFEPVPDGTVGPEEPVVYAGYDEAGRLVGLAVEAHAMGYQDVIRLLYGYAFDRDAIVGIRVLESRETPGLGDRIETDPAFLASLEHLDVTLAADGAALAHPIELVKSGKREQPWQVDGITGATISSAAVATALRQSAAVWIPRVRRDLDVFRSPR